MCLQQRSDDLALKVCRQHSLNAHLLLAVQLAHLATERVTALASLESAKAIYIASNRERVATEMSVVGLAGKLTADTSYNFDI